MFYCNQSEQFLELFAGNDEESSSVQLKRGGYRFGKGGSRGRSRATGRGPLVEQRGYIRVPAQSIMTALTNGSHNAMMSESQNEKLISKPKDSAGSQRFLQAPQMKLCTDKIFPAHIIGADGYGFIYIHVDNAAITNVRVNFIAFYSLMFPN